MAPAVTVTPRAGPLPPALRRQPPPACCSAASIGHWPLTVGQSPSWPIGFWAIWAMAEQVATWAIWAMARQEGLWAIWAMAAQVDACAGFWAIWVIWAMGLQSLPLHATIHICEQQQHLSNNPNHSPNCPKTGPALAIPRHSPLPRHHPKSTQLGAQKQAQKRHATALRNRQARARRAPGITAQSSRPKMTQKRSRLFGQSGA